jgi:hypothetical protein
VTAFRASAPLRATIAGAEVAALAPLVDTGCVSVRLERRARVLVRARKDDHRARIRGLGRALLVEPALEPAVDEGALALEGWLARALAPGEALDVEVDAEDAPDLASLEARAEAFAAALGALHGARGSTFPVASLAARAGSPLLGVPALEGPLQVAVSSHEGWRALECKAPGWAEELLLFRDPHAPPEPSARLALSSWHEGRHHEDLREAARAARACARVASRGGATLAALVEREARALSVLVPTSLREDHVDARLRAAGSLAVRRSGRRGLILLVAPRARHEAIAAAAALMNLERIETTLATSGVLVEEVPE